MSRDGINESFKYITDYAKDHDPIKVLSIMTTFKYLLSKNNIKTFAYTQEIGLYIETYARIALSHKRNDSQQVGIEFKSLCLLLRHLKNYVFQYNFQFLLIDPNTIDEPKQFLLKKHLEARYTMVRGESYEHILLNATLCFYSGIESMFNKILGFTIEDVIKVTSSIRESLIDRLQKIINSKKIVAPLKKAFEIIDSGGNNPFSFTLNKIVDKCQTNKDVVEKILNRLSQSAGYSNSFYPNVNNDPKTSLAEYNTIFEKPFIYNNDLFFMFFPEYLPSIIFNTFWYDLRSNNEFNNDFSTYCGNWVEQETAKCFKRLLPNADIILNPRKSDNNELCDVLIAYDNKLIIVQCKAKRLTFESQRGANWNVIKKDFFESLVHACQQGDASINYLRESSSPIIEVQGVDFEFDPKKYSKEYLVCVTGNTISFQHSSLPEICNLIGESIVNTPWALSLFDLIIISEMIDNPGVFFNYLCKRIDVMKKGINIIGDEIDFLGWFFTNGMNNDFESKKINKLVLDYTTKIDEYYYGFSQTKPTLHVPMLLKQVIDRISRIELSHSTDCINEVINTYFIDEFDISEQLEVVQNKSIIDNKRHSSSYYSEKLDTYFFIVAESDNITVDKLFNFLKNFCLLKSESFQNTEPSINKVNAKKFVSIGKINNSSNYVDAFFYMEIA